MKNIVIVLGIIILLAVGGYLAFNHSQKENVVINGNGVSNIGGVQSFVLSTKNANYYPQEIRVKVNEPVSISLDRSVTGCFRSFTIKEFGISKYLATPQDSLEFTPSKKGKFKFACSMGMGYGDLIVE